MNNIISKPSVSLLQIKSDLKEKEKKEEVNEVIKFVKGTKVHSSKIK